LLAKGFPRLVAFRHSCSRKSKFDSWAGTKKQMNERIKMKELMNELKVTVSRTERFLIYGLGIFTAVGTVTVLIGIINQ